MMQHNSQCINELTNNMLNAGIYSDFVDILAPWATSDLLRCVV